VVEVPSYARGDAAGHGSFDCARLAPRFAQDDKANNGVPAIFAQLCSTGLRPAAQTRAVWAYVIPARFTCARAQKSSPTAGASRFTLNSTLSTSWSSGAMLRAA